MSEGTELLPLSVLGLDYQPTVDGWVRDLEREGIELLTDDLGRLAIRREDARRLFADRRAREERAAERRRVAEAEARPLPVARGVPAISGDGFIDMLIADGVRPREPVAMELLSAELSRSPVGQREERWVKDGSFDRGHWEQV